MDSWLALAIRLAAWFQGTVAFPSQNGASAVWSSVRVDPVMRPSALTWLKSSVYVALSRLRGGPGLNWVLLTSTNGFVNANPWALMGPNAGGVGRH
jgi:hypothetical protein